MPSTTNLELPLVQASQAQKHVTVNEAFARIDTLTQLTMVSRSLSAPPASPAEGEAYGVPSGASGAWVGQDAHIAIYLNGGWDFVAPRVGWRAWVDDEGVPVQWTGQAWEIGTGVNSASGAAMTQKVIEIDHVVGSGPTSTTGQLIPSHAIVFGVTGIVLNAIGGAATSWRLGIAGVSDDRYGSGLGLGTGAWLRGLTAQPLTYYADTALTLTGEGGDLGGGTVRLAVHLAELGLPSSSV